MVANGGTPEKSSHGTIPWKGLTPAQVEESRRKYGANVLTPPEREPWWKLYLEKFDDPVIRILMIAALIALGVGVIHGKYLEAVGVIMAIFLATTMAFLNEYKANREFDILNRVNDEVPVKTIRDGNFTMVPKKDLVFGDVIMVEMGEELPADGRVLDAVSFQVMESRLTGESLPVTKVPSHLAKSEASAEAAYPPDRVMRGTTVADGHATIEVTAVGNSSEIGKTALAAAEKTEEETPLTKQLEQLSKLIGVFGFLFAGLTFTALVVRGIVTKDIPLNGSQWFFSALLAVGVLVALVRVWLPVIYDAFELCGLELRPPGWLESDSAGGWARAIGSGGCLMALGVGLGLWQGWLPTTVSDWLPAEASRRFIGYFMIAVTIIVVAVPEGLAMSVTLSLAYSMRKMAAANNLVRHMHACETIGAATVICSDKTGTLTMNEMRVQVADFPALDGKSLTKDTPTAAEKLVVEAISANTTANLSRESGRATRPMGNPTECALLFWLDDLGIDYFANRLAFAVTKQWTFSTERKFMATLGESAATDSPVLHVKGAPEIILARCNRVLTADGPNPIDSLKSQIEAKLKDCQRRGMRTLAVAYHEEPSLETNPEIEDLARELTWVGFVAIADPIRPEVPDAVKACRAAGIKVKMVTGDNPETAQEIARQIHLWEETDDPERQHLTGPQFAHLEEEQAKAAACELKLLSRARPMDKLRLVRSLQEQGEVVAVTGDGTNDAPALNYANVGLSMGRTGTSVAKEASDIVLLDDSFGTIVNAVMWGRSLYQNIQRFIVFQLTINVAALGIALLGPFIGVELPFTVIQMLWVNLIMDTFAALALATEPPHWDVMKQPPRHPEAFIITPAMARNIFGTGIAFLVFLVAGLVYIKYWLTPAGEPVALHDLSVFFSVFVMLQLWNLFNARSLGLTKSALAGLTENKGFVAIASAIFVGQIIFVQFGGEFFRTVPLSLKEWIVIICGTSVVLWIGEIRRWLARRRDHA